MCLPDNFRNVIEKQVIPLKQKQKGNSLNKKKMLLRIHNTLNENINRKNYHNHTTELNVFSNAFLEGSVKHVSLKISVRFCSIGNL